MIAFTGLSLISRKAGGHRRVLMCGGGVDDNQSVVALDHDHVAEAAVRRVVVPDRRLADLQQLFLEIARMIAQVLRRRNGTE
jgi:hypothetical protein